MIENFQQNKTDQKDQHIDNLEPTENIEQQSEAETDTAETIATLADENVADSNQMDTIESLQADIQLLKETVDANLEKAVRAQAELDNVRKRTSRDIENAHKYALERFINELLPVLDSMELSIQSLDTTTDIQSVREGNTLTIKMFVSVLEKIGVELIHPQEGDKFNPDQHNAVSVQENNASESGVIISILQKGFQLNGRLIRPAMVIVTK